MTLQEHETNKVLKKIEPYLSKKPSHWKEKAEERLRHPFEEGVIKEILQKLHNEPWYKKVWRKIKFRLWYWYHYRINK